MSNVFAKQGVLFVPVPAVALDSWQQLKESERSLYLCLLRLAQKHSAIELHIPAYFIHDYTGLHPETVGVARRGLEKRNWIRCSKGANGVIVYQLLNPNTGTVLPAPTAGDKKFSGIFIYKSKGRSARTVRDTAKVMPTSGRKGLFDFDEIPWDEIGKPAPAQPLPKIVPVCGPAVSTLRPSRYLLPAQPLPSIPEAHENASTCERVAPCSEKSLKKEDLNQGLVGNSEQLEAIRDLEGKNGKKRETRKGKKLAAHEQKKKAAPLAENPDAEPVRCDVLDNPIVLGMQENFGATVRQVIDLKRRATLGTKRGIPYSEWMDREITRQFHT